MRLRRWGPWVALGVVVAVFLAIGAQSPPRPATLDQKVIHLADQIRCPSCADLSAAESDASTARAVRADIRAQILAGHSDSAIKASLVGKYGTGILLSPASKGLDGLVWVLPVIGVVLALGVIGAVFWRRRGRSEDDRGPSDEDRSLVEAEVRKARAMPTGTGR